MRSCGSGRGNMQFETKYISAGVADAVTKLRHSVAYTIFPAMHCSTLLKGPTCIRLSSAGQRAKLFRRLVTLALAPV
jgi:hypothetical protein